MKSTIDKLAVGKIEYNTPKISLSVTSICDTVETGSYYNGIFTIDGVDEALVKGVIYSSNNRIEIETAQFNGAHNVIRFKVNACDVCDSEHIIGKISIVSNAGEFYVPVDITVLDYAITSSIGKIENYFHFANLVQLNYEEAFKLFISNDFRRLLAKNDAKDVALYDGLIQSVDKNLALEQFLIVINKKKPVVISLENNAMHYNDLEENYADIVTLTKSTWGYTDISVEVQGKFLKECKGKIRQDDFTGNKCEYRYLIDTSALYSGKNYGRLTFRYNNQELVYNITINNVKNDIQVHSYVNKKTYQMVDLYLKFRMKKISMQVWANDTLELANSILHTMPEHKLASLVKAQVLISQNKMVEAHQIIEEFTRTKLVDMDKDLDLYCYFLYVKSLEKREVTYTASVLSEVKKLYERENNWRMLWVLLYIDERYEINKSLKYTMLKEQFARGCRSPLMYFEALNILNEQPRLLRILNTFEQQILLFGSKNDFISEGLAKQFVEIASTEKKYTDCLYRILTGVYNVNEDSETLNAICSLIIRGNKIGEEYLKWYRLGIEADVRLTNLYEYYIMSLPEDYEEVLPKMVYMYFLYNGESLGRYQTFLYSNIIRNKKRIPNIYSNYVKVMEQYLVDQLFVGNMDRDLAVIYADILKFSIINGDIAKNLPDVLMTYELKCDDKNIKEVVIIHKEVIGETVYKINEGRAYVSIYTEEPTIVFVDTYGKRYCDIPYTVKPLLDMQEYLRTCFELHRDNEYLLLHFAEKYTKYHKNLLESVDVYKSIMEYSNIKPLYKQEIVRDIVDYYYDNFKGDKLDEYLTHLDKSQMDKDTRDKLIDMMLVRGLYEEVYEEIKKYGYFNIIPRSLVRCCTRIIEIADYEQDTFLTEMCMYVFRKGKYNEQILEYLSRYFNGTVDEMLEIWKADNDFVYENHGLEERILTQVMFTKNYEIDVEKVFRSYYRYGVGKTIRLAYYTFASYSIFMRWVDRVARQKASYIFGYIEKDMMENVGVSNICKIALLEYASGIEQMNESQKKLYYDVLIKLSNYSVIFEFYKKFSRWFELPFYVTDSYIVDYRTGPAGQVTISYTIGNDKEETRLINEPMNMIIPGVYVKSFTLFYGDTLNYYINETKNDVTFTTDKHTIKVNNPNIYNDGSRYSMINNILIASKNGDEEKYKQEKADFENKKQITENIFHIC